MSKSMNLGYQMTQAINKCMADGQSKREYKNSHAGNTDYKIFGFSYKNDLCQTAKELGQFIHQVYPDVKLAKDIKGYMVQAFIDSKSQTVRRATVEKTFSYVRKLDSVVTHVYHAGGFSSRLTMPDMAEVPKLKSRVMQEDDYKRLTDSLRGSRSAAGVSVILSYRVGLRLEETCGVKFERFSDVGGKWGYGTFTVLRGDGSKGNRPRVVDIPTKEARDEIRQVVQGLQPGQLIVTKGDGSAYDKRSITRTISRHMEKLGFSADWKQNKNHAMRKAFAQDCYDVARRSGMTIKQALGYVNRQLGHSENRSDLSDTYVGNQW